MAIQEDLVLDTSAALASVDGIAAGLETSLTSAAQVAAQALVDALAGATSSLVIDIPAPDLSAFDQAILGAATTISDTIGSQPLLIPVDADLVNFIDSLNTVEVSPVLIPVDADLVNFIDALNTVEIPPVLVPVDADLVTFIDSLNTVEIPPQTVTFTADTSELDAAVAAFNTPVDVTVNVDASAVTDAFAAITPPEVDITVTVISDDTAITEGLPAAVRDTIDGLDTTIVFDADTTAFDQIPAELAGVLNDLDFSPIPEGIAQAVAAADLAVPFTADTSALLGDLGALDVPPVAVTFTADSTEVSAALGDLNIVLPVTVDTDAIIAQLNELQLPTLDVQGLVDTSAVLDQIEAMSASIPEITIPVAADTGDAEAAISGIGDAAGAQTAGLTQASDATGGLTRELEGAAIAQASFRSATALASADAGGAGSAFGSLASKLGTTGQAAVAAAATYGVLFHAGVELVAGQQRFNETFGASADEIRKINFGGLKGDLADLAEQSGNSSAKLEAAISNVGRFGQASKASSGQIKETTNAVSALSLRATVLRPELGEAGDVANRLSLALSRGGRFALNYGLSLDPIAIKARAVKIALADGRTEVTQFDRVTAGAQLSAEGLGKTVGTSFKNGLENATVQMRILRREMAFAFAQAGAPLVQPTIDALHELIPSVQSIAEAFGSLAQAGIPIVVGGFQLIGGVLTVVSPLLKGVAAVVGEIPGPVIAAAIAWKVLNVAMTAETGVIAAVTRGVLGLGSFISSSARGVLEYARAHSTAGRAAVAAAEQEATLAAVREREIVATEAATVANADYTVSADGTVVATEAQSVAVDSVVASYDTETVAMSTASTEMAILSDNTAGLTVSTDLAVVSVDGLVAAEELATETSVGLGAALGAALGPIGIVAVIAFTAANALGVFDGAEDKAADSAKKLAASLLDVKKASDGKFNINDEITKFLNASSGAKNFATTYGDSIKAAGVQQEDFNKALINGGADFERLSQHLTTEAASERARADAIRGHGESEDKAAAAAQRHADQLTHLKTVIDNTRDSLRDQANTTIESAKSEGLISEATIKRVASENNLSLKLRDRVKLAGLLLPLIAKGADLEKNTVAVTADQTARLQILNSSLGGTAAGWAAFAAGAARGSITAADFATQAKILGADIPTLQAVFKAATDAVDKFVDDAVSKLPQVGDAIKAVSAAGAVDLGSSLSSFGSIQKEQADQLIGSLQHQAAAAKVNTTVQVTAINQQIAAQTKLAVAIGKSDTITAQGVLSGVASLQNQRRDLLANETLIEGDAKKHADNLAKSVDATSFDLSGFEGFLAGQQAQIAEFFAGINQIAAEGQPELAAKLSAIGPQAGAALVAGLVKAEPAGREEIARLLTPDADPGVLLSRLQAQDAQIQAFTSNLSLLIKAGFGGIAKTLIEQGPEAGGATADVLAKQVFGGNDLFATALNNEVTINQPLVKDAFGRVVRDGIGGVVADDALRKKLHELYPGLVLEGDTLGQGFTQGTSGAISSGTPKLQEAVKNLLKEINGPVEAGDTLALPQALASQLEKAGIAVQSDTQLPAALRRESGLLNVTFQQGFNPKDAAVAALLGVDFNGEKTGLFGKARKLGKDTADAAGKGANFLGPFQTSAEALAAGLPGLFGPVSTSLDTEIAGIAARAGVAFGSGLQLVQPTSAQLLLAAATVAQDPTLESAALLKGGDVKRKYNEGLQFVGVTQAQIVQAEGILTADALLPAAAQQLSGTAAQRYQEALLLAGATQTQLDGAVNAINGDGTITTTAGTKGEEVGGSFSDGLGRGIHSKTDTVVGEAEAVVIKAIAAVQRALASFSPSRVMIKQGENFGDGLALGIKGRGDLTESSAREVATKAIRAVSTVFSHDVQTPAITIGTDGLTESIAHASTLLSGATAQFDKALNATPLQLTKPIEVDTVATRQFLDLGKRTGAAFVTEVANRTEGTPLVNVGVATARTTTPTDTAALAAQIKEIVVSLDAATTGNQTPTVTVTVPVTVEAKPGMSKDEADAQGTVIGEAVGRATTRAVTSAIRNI